MAHRFSKKLRVMSGYSRLTHVLFKSDILKRVNNHKSSPSVKTCNTICSHSLNISNNIISSTHLKDSPITLVGGFNPLKKILVSWDHSSQYIYIWENHPNVPSHQPDWVWVNHYQPLLTTIKTTIKPAINSTDPINSKLHDSIACAKAGANVGTSIHVLCSVRSVTRIFGSS